MGIDSSMQIGYGFRIPKREYNNLLKRQTVKSDEYEIGDYTGDDKYTHELFDEERTFIYGRIIYETEAREYIENGNREVVDLKKLLKIHHMQKRKIDTMAKKCGAQAIYFAIAIIY